MTEKKNTKRINWMKWEIGTNNYFNSNIIVNGLSVHIGSQIMSLNPFKKVFIKIKKLIKKINKEKKIIKTLDLGGGIGINYKNSRRTYGSLTQQIFNFLKFNFF